MELEEFIVLVGFILIFASAYNARDVIIGNIFSDLHKNAYISPLSKVLFLIGLIFLSASFYW